MFKLGMILQAISFVFYCIIYIIWVYRVRQDAPQIWTMSESVGLDGTPLRGGEHKWSDDWRTMAGALAFSCCGIFVRQFSNE